MQDNRDFIQKADFLLANLTSGGGLLQPDQATQFIRLLIDNAVVLPKMQEKQMAAPTALLEKVKIGSSFLKSATEAEALPVAQRTKPDTSKVTLTTVPLKGETRMSYESVEDNIEKGQFENTVRQLLAQRASVDLENIAFNGNTSSSDDTLKVLNGFIAQAGSHPVVAGGASLTRALLKDILKSMPSAYRTGRQRNLEYFTSDEAEIDWHETIADRATALGDRMVESGEVPLYQGIPVSGVPLIPSNLGGGTNETVVLLTDPKNMIFGIWRNITIESMRDISAQTYVIVMTCRVDFKYAHEDAVVKATGVRAS
jgi:HK97 family phage major capsid protein